MSDAMRSELHLTKKMRADGAYSVKATFAPERMYEVPAPKRRTT